MGDTNEAIADNEGISAGSGFRLSPFTKAASELLSAVFGKPTPSYHVNTNGNPRHSADFQGETEHEYARNSIFCGPLL